LKPEGVQEAFLRALKYFGGFRGEADQSCAWLLAIVRNCSMTWLSRHRNDGRNTSLDDDSTADLSAGDEADAAAIQSSERRRIDRAMAALPVEFREVIVLRELEDLSYREISDVVGVPVGTVMSRLSRARNRLADLLLDAREAS